MRQRPTLSSSVLSWNVYPFNPTIDRAAEFIATCVNKGQIVCLQEVPPALLAKLEKMPAMLYCGIDAARRMKKDGSVVADSLVIITKHPMTDMRIHRLPAFRSIPRRARWFTDWASRKQDSDFVIPGPERLAISARIQIGMRYLRVFCVHLTFFGPRNRTIEFRNLLDQVNRAEPTIIAGDLNIFDHPGLKIFNWFAGGSICSAMPWSKEREEFEKRIMMRGFKNPLRYEPTFHLGAGIAGQLDHVLVPSAAQVVLKRALSETFGSDHRPVLATCEIY